MAAITYTKIIFALAMLFLGDQKASKISFVTDNGRTMVWTPTTDGEWSHTEQTGPTTEETTSWTYDPEKGILTIHGPARPGAETIDLGKMIKIGPEKDQATSIDVGGQVMMVSREGHDVTFASKQDAGSKQVIHYDPAPAGDAK